MRDPKYSASAPVCIPAAEVDENTNEANASDDRRRLRGLLRRAWLGSDDAAREIVERYGPDLRLAVRRRLTEGMRREFDSLDIMQDVWMTFFAQSPGESPRFPSPEALYGYLAQIARRQIFEQFRRSKSARRGGRQGHVPAGGPSSEAVDPPGRGATPSQVAAAREGMEALLSGLSERDRQIVRMRGQGFDADEIGRQLGISKRSVQRVLAEAVRGKGRV